MRRLGIFAVCVAVIMTAFSWSAHASKAKFERTKPHVNVGTIGSVGFGQGAIASVEGRLAVPSVNGHLDDAFEAPGAASAHPRDGHRKPGRRRTAPPSTRPEDLRARAASATGTTFMASIRRAIPHRAGDASGKVGSGLPATSPARRCARCSMTTTVAGTMATSPASIPNHSSGIADRRVRRLGAGSRPRGPSARPACGPTSRAGSRCAAASASPPAACSVHRWTSRRSSSSMPPETAPNRSVSTRGQGLHDSLDS